MNRIKRFAVTIYIIFFHLSIQAQDMIVASYNLRYDNKADTVNAWSKRVPRISGLIRFHGFEIFGTQEGLHHQLEDLQAALDGFEYIGVGRDDGNLAGEFAAIFYKTDLFDLEEQGNFWLSLTPDQPSVGWDAALPRVCSWGKFREKQTGESFYLFNVHFDHRGEEARQQSTKLVLEKMEEIAGNIPVILTGDFNFSHQHPNYRLLQEAEGLNDAFHQVPYPYVPNGTFNGFSTENLDDRRIDHIFISPDFEVLKYGILTDTYYGKFPSDHFPVMTTLIFQP
ncbi:MAG: endonuclease/exonuclease/phosphatase family protein [Candidatus Cyclobacteriaceae bacterium M3_2C_046]